MNSNRSKEAIGRALITAGSLALLGAAYQRLLRRRVVDSGAARDEAANRIAGHELLDEMRAGATRAVTIDFPPEAIWPWFVQMSSGVGGVRVYDWIERLLWLDVRSADGSTSELYGLHEADHVRSRLAASDPGVRVVILKPVSAVTTRSEDGTWLWTFLLVPHESPALSSRPRANVSTPADAVEWLRWRSERG